MSMTKKEQAEMAALRQALAEARALRFPDYPVPPRLDPPEGSSGDVRRGWTFNAYSGSVSKGWFGSGSHGEGDGERRLHLGSQGVGGPWYATKREALQALRIVKTHDYAKALAALDQRIAAEEIG